MSSSKFNPRRRRILALGSLLSVPVIARAQTTLGPSLMIPSFGQAPSGPDSQAAAGVPPYRSIATQPAFSHAVAEIMEWTCPYCRQINDGAVQWGGSLPKGWVFVQLPVITDAESLRAAALFAAIQQVAGHRLAAFGDAMFAAVQDRGQNPNDPRTLMDAAQASGIPYASFRTQNTGARVRKTAAEWLALEQAVRPQRTPTFVVAGRQVTDSSMTAARYDLLFQLLSGLVSQAMTGEH